MSNVSLTIGGRVFTVACAEGEEDHVARLGRMIHEKVATMGEATAQSDVRTLLFAALLLADELAELRPGTAASVAAAGPVPHLSFQTVSRAEKIAERLENLADRLEG